MVRLYTRHQRYRREPLSAQGDCCEWFGYAPDVLRAAHGQFGAALLNTRSTTWRGLDAAERVKDPLELLAAHPTLMKRPLIDDDGTLYLGWGKDVQAALT